MPVLYERYNQKYQSSMSVYGTEWRAMTFTIGTVSNNTQFYIKRIRLFIYREGTTPGTCTVAIRATSGGLPTGANLGSGTFNGNAVPTSPKWVEVSVGNALATPSTQYVIVLSVPTGDASNKIIWKQNSMGVYAGGNRCDSADSGVNWTSGGASTAEMFEVYGGSVSLWHGKSKTAIPTNMATYYNRLTGGSTWVVIAVRARRYGTSCAAGVLRNFRVKLDTAPGAGKTWTFKIWKAGASTAVVVAITGTATEGIDTTNSVTIAANDRLLIEAVPTTTPAIPTNISWCVEYESVSMSYSQIHGASETAFIPASNDYWCPLMGNGDRATTRDKYHIMPIAGTLYNLYVYASAVLPALTTATFTVEKNDVATTLTVTVAAGASYGAVTSNVAFVAGDKFTIKANTSNTTDTVWCWSCTVYSTVEGDFICAHNYGIDSLATLYNAFALSFDAWNASETGLPGISSPMTIYNMYMVLEVAPGASGTKTFTLRKNAADTTMTVTMTGATLVASDTTHYQSIAAYDTLSMKETYTGTPVVAHPCMSFKCRIPVAYTVYPQEIIGAKETVSATVTHGGVAYESIVPEKIGLMETSIANACFQPTVNELLGVKDMVSEVATLQRTVNETLGIKDTPVTYMTIQKTINEILGMFEVFPTFPKPFPLSYQLGTSLYAGKQTTVNEILGIKETATDNALFNRTVDEKIGLFDTTGKWATLSRTINEIIGLLENYIVTRKRQSITTELFGLLDVVSAILSAVKTSTVNETLGLLDTKTVISGFVRIVPETLGIKDTPVLNAAKFRTFTELIGYIETASATLTAYSTYERIVNEIIGFKETASQTTKFSRTIPEFIGFKEITSNVGTFSKTVTELLGIKDTPWTGIGYGRSINEKIGLLETASGTLYAGLQVTVNEKLGVLNTVSQNTTFSRTVNEQLGLTDTSIIGVKYGRTVNEMIGLMDTVGIKKWVQIYEKLGLIDSASTIKNYIWTNYAYQFDINVYY